MPPNRDSLRWLAASLTARVERILETEAALLAACKAGLAGYERNFKDSSGWISCCIADEAAELKAAIAKAQAQPRPGDAMTPNELYAETHDMLSKWNLAGKDILASQIVDLARRYHAQASATERERDCEAVAAQLQDQMR